MKRLLRLFSRIAIRLMAFNLLLVFLPLAGILYLDVYERHLIEAQQSAMTRIAWLASAALSRGDSLDLVEARRFVARIGIMEVRVRIVATDGRIVGDSYPIAHRELAPAEASEEPTRRHWLYRLASFLIKKPLRILKGEEELDERADAYETSSGLRGGEVEQALAGSIGSMKRRGSEAVYLYAAVPIRANGAVVGAAVVSESTARILQDLYAVRLGVSKISLASLLVAGLLSIWVGATIVRPIRELRIDARGVLDRRGRFQKRFRGSRRRDEIGELARALERLTRNLEQHQQFIESFASDVAHEFKNPLASIRNAAEMLATVQEPVDRDRFLSVIQREIARLEQMISTLREVTRIDAQLASETRSAVDLDSLVSKIVEGFRYREGSRVAFAFESAGHPLVVMASEERLLQIFENILDNATSFAPDQSTITVTLGRESEEAVVRVRDEGAGIPGGNLDRIFDRFFTDRPDGSRRDGHVGLGLAIVRAIVEGYGGRVTAANAEKGGAVFEVRLP